MLKDLVSNISVATSLSPAARTATANGTGVDLRGYESSAVVIQTGTITDGTHTVDVKESDDNVTFASVAASDLKGTLPAIGAANDDVVYEIGYFGRKRFIRVDVTVAGATTGGIYGATVVRGHARKRPV